MLKINIGDGSHVIRAWVQKRDVVISETSIPGCVGDDVPEGHPETVIAILHFDTAESLQVMLDMLEALREYFLCGEPEFVEQEDA